MKAKGAYIRNTKGYYVGSWKTPTFNPAPINAVQTESRYPMILAVLELLKNVWKRIESPIWASIHPNRITNIIKKGV